MISKICLRVIIITLVVSMGTVLKPLLKSDKCSLVFNYEVTVHFNASSHKVTCYEKFLIPSRSHNQLPLSQASSVHIATCQ